MANEQQTGGEVTQTQLLKTLVELHQQQVATAPIRQVPTARATYRTPWNPTGKKIRVKLTRKVFQNGHQLREGRLSEEEIKLLNDVQPGLYQNRRWVVKEVNSDGVRQLYIQIPNKTQADRMDVATKARDFAGILRLILEEAKTTAAAA